MADSVTERLAAIRARHQTYVDRHSHTSFACCSAHPPADDVPGLLDALEAILKLADRLDDDAASLRRRGVPSFASGFVSVERGDRCAGLNHAAQDIRQAVANALGKEAADA